MGGGSWKDIPEKYKPHWSKWKIEGTPLEETQRRLKAKGLHDPWIRNDAWVYSLCDKNANPVKVLRRGLVPGFMLFLGIITLEKMWSSAPSSSHH